ncbi:MAG: hypothetical protein JW731_10760 [Bacteroidales bacterium]|nr:hypothetical protein [Bacteroidales bacterium]
MTSKLSNIKSSIGRYVFERKLNHLTRNKRLINLNDAKSVVIVYNVINQDLFTQIKLLVKELTTRNRQVMALGFVNRNSIPNYCVAANSGYYFDLKDLNWFGAPKNDYIKEFIKKEFDILIDLTLEDNFVTQFIAGLSRSKFKVGRYSPNHEQYYDLMIDIKKNSTIEEFIENVIHYLLVLKPRQA